MNRLQLLIVLLLAACRGPEPEPEPVNQPQGVVDSILPVEEEIRRFKAQVGAPFPTTLEPVANSRTELVRTFFRALERADTATIRTLVLNSREFIELYYPHSPYTRPPYRQSPSLFWFLLQQNSEKGISRLLDRFGGGSADLQGLDCKPEPSIQGPNRLWECTVRLGRVSEPARLFGTIIERDGSYKFLSYANDL